MAGPSFAARLWSLRGLPLTRPQKFALGLIAVGVIAAITLPLLLVARQWRYSTYITVTATVKAVEPAVEDVSEGWEVRRAGSVTLDYVASGLPQTVTLAATRFDADRIVVGNSVPLHVNPNKLGEVETENTWHNILMTLLFTLASVVMAAAGGLLFRWLTPELAAEEPDDDDDGIFEPMPQRPRRR
mgnify:CR=1 FL=1